VKKWIPRNEHEKQLEAYAVKLNQMREKISQEMKPFLEGSSNE
jgi:hypothetical protein